MISPRSYFVAALLGAAFPIAAQMPRLVPLPMDPPVRMLQAMPAGAVADDKVLHLSIALPYADPEGMQRFVDSVSDPRSSMYRRFVSPEEVGSRFGLPQAAIQKVKDYLTSQGMQIHRVAKNHLAILADATVAQANAAFHTSVESFVSLTPDTTGVAPLFSFTVSPSVPAEISAYVGYVGGLENFTRPKAMSNPVTPTQLRSFYNVAPLYGAGAQGLGRTIGISNFDGFSLASVGPWYQSWSLPAPAGGYGANITDEVPPGDTSGANAPLGGEGDLDIQCALAMAPLANLIIYDAGYGSSDLIGVLTLEADDNKADIITESYGWEGTSSLYASAHNLHLSMSAQGITYICASGDSGTASMYGTGSHPYPDIDPEVLTVSGTATYTSSAGALTSQTDWSNYYEGSLQAGGGGWYASTDAFNTLPSWQKGAGVPSNVNYRLVPDVAANADDLNSPFYIYLQSGEDGAPSTGLWYGIGGTSGASPTFAGSLADAEQKIIANGGMNANSLGKRRFGRIAPLLYSFNGSSSIFTDITSGSSTGTLPNGQSAVATTGWDFTTGWGVMNFDGFVTAESGSNPPPNPPTLASLTSSSASVTGGVTNPTITATLSGPAGAGGATVTVAVTPSTATTLSSTTITIPEGATSATVTANTKAVVTSVSCTVTGASGGVSKSASFTDVAATVSSVSLSASSVVGGGTVSGTVTLTGPAGPTSRVVHMYTHNSPYATVPSVVAVPAGASKASFTVTTTAPATATNATVTVTLTTSASATLTVKP